MIDYWLMQPTMVVASTGRHSFDVDVVNRQFEGVQHWRLEGRFAFLQDSILDSRPRPNRQLRRMRLASNLSPAVAP